jgi:hypothetical protein
LRLVIAYLNDIVIICRKPEAEVLDDSQLRLEMNNAKTTVFSPLGDLADAANWNCKVQPGAFLTGMKDGLQQLQTSFPEDYDWWAAFLRDTEQQPSTALNLKPYRESLRRSLNKVTSAFQAFSTTPFLASLRGTTGDDVTIAETDVMYPRTLERSLLLRTE